MWWGEGVGVRVGGGALKFLPSDILTIQRLTDQWAIFNNFTLLSQHTCQNNGLFAGFLAGVRTSNYRKEKLHCS